MFIIVGLLLGIIFFGPMLSAQLATSLQQIFVNLTPVVGTVSAVIFAVIAIKYYWRRS